MTCPRLLLSLIAVVITVHLTKAHAASVDLKDFIKAAFCTRSTDGQGDEINPTTLLKELTAAYPVSDDARDLNNDGELKYDETVEAIADPLRCTSSSVAGAPPPCRDKDRSQLNRMRNRLIGLVDVADSGETLTIESRDIRVYRVRQRADGHFRLAKMTPEERREEDASWLLSRVPRRFFIACTASTHAPEPSAHSPGGKGPAKPTLTTAQLVLRGKATELLQPLSKENASKLSAASLSYKDDAHGNAESIAIDAVAGIVFDGEGLAERNITALAPYVRIERKQISKDEKITTDIDNLGFGVVAGAQFITQPIIFDLSIRPEFVTSMDFDSSVFYAELALELTPDLGCFGALLRLGLVDLRCQLRGLGDAGYVSDAGGRPALIALDDYTRLGFDAQISLSGNEKSFLDPFQLNVFYKNLQDFSGALDLRRLEASVAYNFKDKIGSGRLLIWEVSVKYVNGEADVTLEDQEYTQLAIGIKY